MAEGNWNNPMAKESLNVTSTSEYVKSISALSVGSTLYMEVTLYASTPADAYQTIPLSFPNNGKSLRFTSSASLQISSSQDIGKTASAVLYDNNNNISLRLGSAFSYDIHLYFVAPYY